MGELEKIVKAAFLSVHDGRSPDDVVIDDELNKKYVAECEKLLSESEDEALRTQSFSDFDFNHKLQNIRKRGGLGRVTTSSQRIVHDEYAHASEIAARKLEDRYTDGNYQGTLDNIFCDPGKRQEFDDIAKSIAPNVDNFRLRKAALALRKARKLQPELIKNIANWGKEELEFAAQELLDDRSLIPDKPGIYIIRDPKEGYLWIGEGKNLRKRLYDQLNHHSNKSVVIYLHNEGYTDVRVDLHVFDSDSDANKTRSRRAYESELISTRDFKFNIRP